MLHAFGVPITFSEALSGAYSELGTAWLGLIVGWKQQCSRATWLFLQIWGLFGCPLKSSPTTSGRYEGSSGLETPRFSMDIGFSSTMLSSSTRPPVMKDRVDGLWPDGSFKNIRGPYIDPK